MDSSENFTWKDALRFFLYSIGISKVDNNKSNDCKLSIKTPKELD